jgi:cytochrome bd-type quinol oxidase subunit 2
MPAKLDHMDEIHSPALLSQREARRRPRDSAAWVGACVLGALTVVALAPPAFVVWLLLGHTSMDWQANHASHVAAARTATLTVLAPVGGAAVFGLATLLSRRRVSVAERARTMAGGAFLASLMLTVGGFVWIMGHTQFTF